MASPLAASGSFGPPQPHYNYAPAPRAPQQPKPVPVDLPALQNASRILYDQFAKDAQIIPDLGETLTASGGQASASYSVFPDDTRVPYQKRRFISIPEGLFQYYDSASVTSHMGLMPELERAWISIDHKLFLWDYNDGQDLSSFVDQPDVITSVTLVRPKASLFIEEISHLLVICTPVSVLLLGVSVTSVPGHDGRSRKEIQFYATDRNIPTDIEMISVVGTQDGRIFMAGAQDGCLYELHYQETESWFGKRVQLINHSVGGVQSLLPRFASATNDDRIIMVVSDPLRDCIYTLTEKNTISIYKPSGEKAVQHIQTLSNVYKSAQDKAPGSPALTPQSFNIISLHVVGPQESRSGIQLLAITTNGVRLYFAPGPSYGYSYTPTTNTVRALQLSHVRLPPSNLLHPDDHSRFRSSLPSYGQMSQKPSRGFIISAVENACYCDGLLVAAQQGDSDGTDYILCTSPDLTRVGSLGQLNAPQQGGPNQQQYGNFGGYTGSTPSRPPLTEYATLLSIPGRTWALAAVPKLASTTPQNAPNPSVINELARQFGESPQQFMLLTNSGLSFISKRRAVDYLKAVLEEFQTGAIQPLIEFRDSFGRDQTCAMLLALASGNTYLDGDASPNGPIVYASPELADVAKKAFYDFGERPIWTERVTYSTADTQGSAIFSGRREGLALYFARLVRPMWKAKLTKLGSLEKQQLNVPEGTLVTIQKNLFALKDFLDKNPHLFHASPGDTPVNQEALKAEQHSVTELLALLTRTIEALSFVLLLNDYQIGELISQCDKETQQLIADQTFEELITTQHGMTISRALVNVVIDQQIGQQISVDTVSEVLQRRCGSFCSTDDVMLYKARENIRKAVETKSPTERQNWLSESLRLFTKGSRIIEFEKLREIIGDYQQLDYAKGAILLPLACAQVFDSDNTGLEHWYSGSPANDPRQEQANQRMQCYDLVMDSLSVFEEKCGTKRPAQVLPGLDEPETVRSHAYELAFASEDEMFHSVLYDWLIGRGLADDLLEMRPAYLEAHLRREPVTVQKYQLLWQFYVKNGQPLRAAEILGALADSNQFDLDLSSRLEYLTLAVANAKSHPISAGGRHETAIQFLTDLEEKLDVAQVQLEIYNTLLPHVSDAPEVEEKVRALSKQLMSMTELYQGYAVAFQLPALQLLCLHVSEHRDESVVRPIWNQIFDEILNESLEITAMADLILSRVVPLGQRFYPSTSAFPLRHIATLLVRFMLAHKSELPYGWAPRILIQCGAPFIEIWDVFHEMYESQIPPFNDQANVQAISSDIAVLLNDWLEEALRPQSSISTAEFPVGRIDSTIDHYLSELEPSRSETKKVYENIKRQLRHNW
ncbi:nucleoporin [Macrolepiota fuliginosa MF-IS2]|uniref:Nucleoporin n=1 Tax=Macrolepiota fuliginosa MF-IS2 TaxID=1400762 RepID=A0A9P6CBG8_9AGAR|nr:nucleoporin [Macrolepiota fuliginosa MF-IS2]